MDLDPVCIGVQLCLDPPPGKPKWPTKRAKKKGQSYVLIKELHVLFSGDLFWSLDVLRGSCRRNILIFCINVICFFTSYSETFGHVNLINRIWFWSVLWNNGVHGSGFAIRIQEGKKWPWKNIKQLMNFIFWSAECSVLRAEVFSRRLGVQFLVIKTLGPDWDPDFLTMLDPDPQHWFWHSQRLDPEPRHVAISDRNPSFGQSRRTL